VTPTLKKAYEALFRKVELLFISGQCQSVRAEISAILRAKTKPSREMVLAKCSTCGKKFSKSASEIKSRKERSRTGKIFCSRSCQVSAQNKKEAP
jgi:hypothetical protein